MSDVGEGKCLYNYPGSAHDFTVFKGGKRPPKEARLSGYKTSRIFIKTPMFLKSKKKQALGRRGKRAQNCPFTG